MLIHPLTIDEGSSIRDRRHKTSDSVRLETLAPKIMKVGFAVIGVETLFAVPYRSVYLFSHSRIMATISASIALVLIAVCFRMRGVISRALVLPIRRQPLNRESWLIFWLLSGLTLRVAWFLLFPTSLKSDNLSYFNIAVSLARGQNSSGAFWPPGFSLFLAPFFALFGPHKWVCLLSAQVLFIATYFCTYALARRVLSQSVSLFAPVLVAIWPGYLTLAGVNSKENLLALLIPASILAYLMNESENSEVASIHLVRRFSWRWVCCSGAIMGMASLTQPGFLLFPMAIFAFELVKGSGVYGASKRTFAFSIALLAAVAPWTIRNYTHFHRVVLISTNGGSVFYRANNPLANANFSEEGEIALPRAELEADKAGYRMAGKWIRHHPIAFGNLMLRKQIVFLGDDALGAYETLRRDLEPPVLLYGSIKAVSNLFWIVFWTSCLIAAPELFRNVKWARWLGALWLPFAYQWMIDSIFESGPRHHVAYVGLLSVLGCCALEAMYTALGPDDKSATLSGKQECHDAYRSSHESAGACV